MYKGDGCANGRCGRGTHNIKEEGTLAELGLGVQTRGSGEFDKQTGGAKPFWAEVWKSQQHRGSGLSKQFDMLETEVRVYGLGSRSGVWLKSLAETL